MNEIVKVPFYGDTMEAIKRDDGVWVGVKRACENVGIDPDTQRRKLQNAGWAVTVMMTATGSDGKNYEMFCIHLDCLPMWLATIDPSRVKPGIRDKLVAYQRECARVLRDHFFGRRGEFDAQSIAAIFAAALAPIAAMMGQIIDRLQNPIETGSVIGSRGSSQISQRLKAYALAMSDDKAVQKSQRSAAELELRVAVGFSGTGRSWANLPMSKWGDVKSKIEELERDAQRIGTGTGTGKSQLGLDFAGKGKKK